MVRKALTGVSRLRLRLLGARSFRGERVEVRGCRREFRGRHALRRVRLARHARIAAAIRMRCRHAVATSASTSCCAAICMPNIAPCCLTRRQRATKFAAVHAPADSSKHSRRFTPDFASGLGQACAGAGDRLDRQRRHVVGRGGAAGGAGRIRRDPRRRVAGLYPDRCSGFGLGGVADRARSPIASASCRRSALSIGFLGTGLCRSPDFRRTLWQFIAVHFADRARAPRRPSGR